MKKKYDKIIILDEKFLGFDLIYNPNIYNISSLSKEALFASYLLN